MCKISIWPNHHHFGPTDVYGIMDFSLFVLRSGSDLVSVSTNVRGWRGYVRKTSVVRGSKKEREKIVLEISRLIDDAHSSK